MASRKKPRSQARKANSPARNKIPPGRDIKLLAAAGLYKGKADARKAPTAYQQKVIAKHKRKLAGLKAADTRRRNAAAAPPQPAGQPRGAKVKRTTMTRRQVETARRPRNPLTTYVLPFNRKDGPPEWRRFTFKGLKTFLAEYVADPVKRNDWRNYAVRETWSFPARNEREEYREGLEDAGFGILADESEPDATRVEREAGKRPPRKHKGGRKAKRGGRR